MERMRSPSLTPAAPLLLSWQLQLPQARAQLGHGPSGRMLPHHELQEAAPHSYLFAPFIQDLDKLSWKPACRGSSHVKSSSGHPNPSPQGPRKGLPGPFRTFK